MSERCSLSLFDINMPWPQGLQELVLCFVSRICYFFKYLRRFFEQIVLKVACFPYKILQILIGEPFLWVQQSQRYSREAKLNKDRVLIFFFLSEVFSLHRPLCHPGNQLTMVLRGLCTNYKNPRQMQTAVCIVRACPTVVCFKI